MEPIHKRVAGLDVHRMKQVATVLIEREDGTICKETREFGGFRRDLRALVEWLQSHGVELVVVESTGVYWQSVFAHLEGAGIPAWVVNARHVKNVPGRKTDVADSEWLAQLARFGRVRASFIPPKDRRELRVVSRYRTKLSSLLASEKNRLHTLLDDAGIKLGGGSRTSTASRRIPWSKDLSPGNRPRHSQAADWAALKNKREALKAAMEGELSSRPRWVLQAALRHVRYLEKELAQLDRYLIKVMQPYAWAWQLLQTLPGHDEIAAAMILIEISDDLSRFGSASRLASWAALCPGNNESAGKRKSGKTRHGNPIVR